MSDAYTLVSTQFPSGRGGLGMWGHEPPQDAIDAARRFFENQRDEALEALRKIEAGQVTVHHQYGPNAGKRRRLVWPNTQDEAGKR